MAVLRKPQVAVGARRDRVGRVTYRKFHDGSGNGHAADLKVRRVGEPDIAVWAQGQPSWFWRGSRKRIFNDVAQAGVVDTGVRTAGVRPDRATTDVRRTAN